MTAIKVELIDHMGDDLRVVNAARVSFAKESDLVLHEWDDEDEYGNPVRHGKMDLKPQDKKLINYLAAHGHWSPFSHCFLTFRIKAPIFVARQLQKHQVGLAWNEVSRRYVDSEPEFYLPGWFRKRAENVKQGSSDERADLNVLSQEVYGMAYAPALRMYKSLLDDGVCPEQARMVLPQSMMTEWYWSGSLYAFARVCKQRLDPHAQRETQTVATDIARLCREKFPVSFHALMITP